MRSKKYPRSESVWLGSLDEPLVDVARRIWGQIKRREWREIDAHELRTVLAELQRNSRENYDQDHSMFGGALISGPRARLWIDKIADALKGARGSGPRRSRKVQEAYDLDEAGLGFPLPYNDEAYGSGREALAALVAKFVEFERQTRSRAGARARFQEWCRRGYRAQELPLVKGATGEDRGRIVRKLVDLASTVTLKERQAIKGSGTPSATAIRRHFKLTSDARRGWEAELRGVEDARERKS